MGMLLLSNSDVHIILKVALDAGRHPYEKVLEGEDNTHIKLLIDYGYLIKCGVDNKYLNVNRAISYSIEYMMSMFRSSINSGIHLTEEEFKNYF